MSSSPERFRDLDEVLRETEAKALQARSARRSAPQVSRGAQVLAGALALLLLGGSLWLCGHGYVGLRTMAGLGSVPRTDVHAILPGEVNVVGVIAPIEGVVLTAPGSSARCVYYRYWVTRTTENSEGRSSTSTVEDKTRFVPFQLLDAAGGGPPVRVVPSDAVEFDATRDWGRRAGDRSYSEYRLHAGDRVHVRGQAERSGEGYTITFAAGGGPISIAQRGDSDQRSSRVVGVLLAGWLGLAVFSLFATAPVISMRSPRVIQWSLVAGASLLFVALGAAGVGLAVQGVQTTHERLEAHHAHAEEAIATALAAAGIEWRGSWSELGSFEDPAYAALDPGQRKRLRRVRVDLARAIDRAEALSERPVERTLASALDRAPPLAVLLPAEDRAFREELEERLPAAGGFDPWVLLPLIVAAPIAVLLLVVGLRRVPAARPIGPGEGLVLGSAMVGDAGSAKEAAPGRPTRGAAPSPEDANESAMALIFGLHGVCLTFLLALAAIDSPLTAGDLLLGALVAPLGLLALLGAVRHQGRAKAAARALPTPLASPAATELPPLPGPGELGAAGEKP